MKYHFRVHKEDGGFWAECIELDGCVTQADTLDDLKVVTKDALNIYLDEPADSKLYFPLPKTNVRGSDVIEVEADPEIAFAALMRGYRLSRSLSQTAMAELLGMEHVYSYQRLEKRSNPTLATLKKIKDRLPEFPMGLVLS